MELLESSNQVPEKKGGLKFLIMVSISFVLSGFSMMPIVAWAQYANGYSTYSCTLKSHDDSLSFTISDPRSPNPVIIGASGSSPLETFTLVTPYKKSLIVLIEAFPLGQHITTLTKSKYGFHAVHLRWSNTDPNEGFYGNCLASSYSE